ncbi:MAG: hypothetical protein ACXW1Z_21915 [Methylobacter sp.]
MKYLLLILIVGAILFYLMKKKSPPRDSSKEVDIPITVTISTSESGTPSAEKIYSGDLVESENGYLLNPKSPFPLTVRGLSSTDAHRLKGYLDEEANWGRRLSEITYLLAQSNATCMEIEDYVKKYRPQYEKTISDLKSASAEWNSASERDQEDMVSEFQQRSLDGLPVQPSNRDILEPLFEDQPSDITADDELVELFAGDTELYRFYVSELWGIGKMRTVPAGDYYRKKYESLVEKRLAKRGQDIGIEQILNGIRLKDINEVLKGIVEKPFGRKAKAIEFALTVPDISERLGKTIAFRELFQLCEPENLDVQEIQKCYRHAYAVATLLKDTYVAGACTLRTFDDSRGIKVDSWRVVADDCCESCRSHNGRTYKRRPSKLPPFHVGCSCRVEENFDGI